MDKTNEQRLGDVIKELLDLYHLEDKILEVRLIDSWEKVTGSMIAKRTKNLYIKNRVLFVHLESAALREELSYARQKILNMLNKEVGKKIIDEVVFR